MRLEEAPFDRPSTTNFEPLSERALRKRAV